MRNLEGVNIYIPNDEALASLNGFHATQALREPIRQGAMQRVHCLFRDIERSFPKAKHLREAIAVVAMFVGDEDAVDTVDAQLDGRESRQSFAFAEAAVHEESGALRLEQCNVARAA